MRTEWSQLFKFDPVTPLLDSGDSRIAFWVEKDLLGKSRDVENLWNLKGAQSILKKQQEDGSWKNPSKKAMQYDHDMFETFRQLGFLVDFYGFDSSHEVIEKAMNYFFSKISKKGDLRGFYGEQYSPNYTGATLALLLKAGVHEKPQVRAIFSYLSGSRQNDGGWAIPFRTVGKNINYINQVKTLEPNLEKPSSYFVTGDVLRAFSEHSEKRKLAFVQSASELLMSYFFKRDRYPDRSAETYWYKFKYPYWYTNLLSALDTLSKIGFTLDHPQISKAIDWFIQNQQQSGLWHSGFEKGREDTVIERRLWVTLEVCRIFKRFYRRNI